jgi:hypothetical protein
VSAAALVSTACGSRAWTITYDGRPGGSAGGAPGMGDVVLTPEEADAYAFESSDTELRAVALPTNTGGNYRSAFWPAAAPSVVDSQSCATWLDPTLPGNTQQGAALRVSTDAAGATRAITVTKNIFYGATWIFNFHVWDTSNAASPYTQIGGADMWAVVGGKPYPWHFCARTAGTSLEMKVWTGDEPEPTWDDTLHGAAVTLAPEWVYPGFAGWYIGHLPSGGSADFTDLATWKYDVADIELRSTDRRSSTGSGGAPTDRVSVSAP